MAKDDIDPEDIEGLVIEETDPDLIEDLEDDEDFLEDDDDVDDVEVDEDDEDDEDADDDVSISDGPLPAKTRTQDDDDDDDVVAPDDVEEDLAEILKDRLAAEDTPAEDEEAEEWDDKTTGDDALQPKRADEVMCTSCFLLVRTGAPVCPVGDESCPIFSAVVPKKRKK